MNTLEFREPVNCPDITPFFIDGMILGAFVMYLLLTRGK